MKQTTLIKSAVLAGSALLAGLASAGDDPAPAASSDLEVSIGVGYNSEYIFRSLNFGDDLFTASIGLSGSGSLLGIGDLDLNAGIDLLTTSNSEGGLHELRVGASATKSLGSFDLTVGVTNYAYFGTAANGDDVLEPYVALGTELAGLDVSIGLYDQDWNSALDNYIEITAGRSVELGGLDLCVNGVVGTWDEFDNTFYGLSVGLPISASDSITVTPHVSALFGDTASGDDEFTVGVNVGFGL
ncbi:MAG: hypothetical protein VX633_14745 [Verrucomicrobiota bacterium]|nr:hypothetical protein [Verrucomicrobiota bacterium]